MPDADDMAARSKRLAKDLLDELDKPKSAEREAYEAQKEREDREALERHYVATGQVTPEQVAQRALLELADAAERIASTGDFDAVEVPLTLSRRKAVLRFGPSPSQPDKRYVELSVWSESELSNSSQWLEKSTNADLIAYLRRPDTVPYVLTLADELIVSLQRHRMA